MAICYVCSEMSKYYGLIKLCISRTPNMSSDNEKDKTLYSFDWMEEYQQFLINTPFGSSTTDIEKLKIFHDIHEFNARNKEITNGQEDDTDLGISKKRDKK